MHIFLDKELLAQARVAARNLVANEEEFAVFSGTKNEGQESRFRLQRSEDGMLVLGSITELGETFFIGVNTSEY